MEGRWARRINISLGILGSLSAAGVMLGEAMPDWAWPFVFCSSGISPAWLQLRLVVLLASYKLPSALSLSLLASLGFTGLLLLSTAMTRGVGELLGAASPLACGLLLESDRTDRKPHAGLPYYESSPWELACGPC